MSFPWNRLAAGALLLVSACGGSSAHSTLTSQAPPPSPAAAAAPAASTSPDVATPPAPLDAPPATMDAPPPPDPAPAPAGGEIGAGEPGTLGHGSGTGTGYGVGSGRGAMRGHESAVPQVRIGEPTSNGDLDKAIIRRYIKRNIAKITFCYEKQLVSRPGLEGTVNAQFFISNTGAVVDSRANGVDAEVSACIAKAIKAIEFPKPKGGGGVQVNYPFNFRPTGG